MASGSFGNVEPNFNKMFRQDASVGPKDYKAYAVFKSAQGQAGNSNVLVLKADLEAIGFNPLKPRETLKLKASTKKPIQINDETFYFGEVNK